MAPHRSRIQIISSVLLCGIVFVFVMYHIISNPNIFWMNHIAQESEVLAEMDPTVGIFQRVIKQPRSRAFHGEKLVHLDLKGAPPQVSYFKEFFPYIKKLGATGVVIEYEDMFFYKDELEDIRALNAYDLDMIRTIRELAEKSNLIVIPLIQTFGHFEFVLKSEKFKDLREISDNPQVLCPSNDRALNVISKMIDQVLAAHPEAKYIHIGCDEVLYLGECGRCKSAMEQKNWDNADLFLYHVKHVAKYINNTYPGVRPIIWGDMIGKYHENSIRQSNIANLVDVMVWKYVPNVSSYITENLLGMYARVFKSIWIASAFKGSTGVNQRVTDVKYHLDNHVAWMEIVCKWKHFMNIKGIVLTGWQRYDHFAELCELLPVGIPSLTVSLSYLNGSAKGTKDSDLLKLMQCYRPFSFSPYIYNLPTKLGRCDFPGSQVYQLVNTFHILSLKIARHFSITNGGWFSFHHILHRFSSPAYVKGTFDDWPVDRYLMELVELEEGLRKALSKIYDVFTVEEWITSYVTPIRIRLEAFSYTKDAMLKQTVWPRRPLLDNATEVEKAAKEICTSGRKFGCALLLT